MKLLVRTNMTTLVALIIFTISALAYDRADNQSLDMKVKKFLESHKYNWHDLNISEGDGQLLYDIIVKNNYKKALEIGTSTGRSTIWIAWALSKTGGKLITVEIDKGRYLKALDNFKEAGLSQYIDARLADAHQLIPQLKQQFDFIFCDADKNWYKNYLTALLPKLEVGGCFTAHNVLNSYMAGIKEFVDYLESLPNLETKIVRSSSSGISVSYKKSD